jgi:ferredoxin
MIRRTPMPVPALLCAPSRKNYPLIRSHRRPYLVGKEITYMKVVVDLKLCEGNMKCQEAAPEVFEVRDDDKSHLLLDRPPERMRDKLKLAARLCPRQAITVSDD